MSHDPVRARIPRHIDPGGLACFQRSGVPIRVGLTRCSCCGAEVIIPFSQARGLAPIVPGP